MSHSILAQRHLVDGSLLDVRKLTELGLLIVTASLRSLPHVLNVVALVSIKHLHVVHVDVQVRVSVLIFNNWCLFVNLLYTERITKIILLLLCID